MYERKIWTQDKNSFYCCVIASKSKARKYQLLLSVQITFCYIDVNGGDVYELMSIDDFLWTGP